MAPRNCTSYNNGHQVEFPWSEADPKNPNGAKCKLCQRTFDIGSMGRSAFLSHAKCKKHERIVNARNSTPSAVEYQAASEASVGPADGGSQEPQQLVLPSGSPSDAAAPDQPEQSQHGPQSAMGKFLLQDNVTKAEVIWCMQAATKIHSNRTAANCAALFPLMFDDSTIAKKMRLDRDKVGYMITYGLAPYFRKQIQDTLNDCNYVTVGFDEALNEVSKKKQMDVMVRFWHPIERQVETRYLTSVFLQHATSGDLRQSLKSAVGAAIERKMVQISMDGPPVNFKMLREYQVELKEENGQCILDLGSCGLHVVHGAFKTGAQKAGWKLKEFLIALHYLFHKSPARRWHFTKVTCSEVFPIAFCFTRWIENDKAGTRAIDMLPHLKTWVEVVRSEGKKNPLNKPHHNFDTVEKGLQDRLLGAKLAFFVSTAKMVEPFLTRFQSDSPMAPLLFRELECLTLSLMERVVKRTVLQKKTRVNQVDLSNENLMAAKDFDLGFATKGALREANSSGSAKIADAVLLQFRKECNTFFVTMLEKIKERSPLTYKLTRGISCLDPIVAVETTETAEHRINTCLEMLTEKALLSGEKADRVKRSYSALMRLPSVTERLGKFDGVNPRLDLLWRDVVESAPASVPAKEDLMSFIELVLILFHGNAALERSFSLNNDCLMVNQKEESLVANRTVQDAVLCAGGIEHVSINKRFIHAARNAHALYQEAKEARSLKEKEEAARVAAKRKATLELKELNMKKQKVIEEALQQKSRLEERIHDLEKIAKH